MSTNWATVETAIQDAIVAASGLADTKVIWADQDGHIPALPYILLIPGTLIPLGAMDEVTIADSSPSVAGAEITKTVLGSREMTLKVQAFSSSVRGTSSPRALLAATQASLALSSVKAILEAAGVSIFDRGTVVNVPGIRKAGFEGRAVLDLRLYCTETVTETDTFIETVNAKSYLGPPDLGTRAAIDI